MPWSTIPVGGVFQTAALGRTGRALTHPVAFDPLRSLGTHIDADLGIQFHGLHARCLRFEITVARVHLHDLARLASGVAVSVVAGGILTPGHYPKFQQLHALLSGQAYPGAPNAQRSDAGWVTDRNRFPGRVVLRRSVVEMARNCDRNTAFNR